MTDPIIVAPEKHDFLAALRYPQYRLLWISALGTYIGRWIEMTVGAWLVLELTKSPFLVGLLGTCRFAAMLLGPFCGAISDRFNRHRILLAVQVIWATASITIATLFLTSRLEVWHLFVFTLVGGICFAFDFSARYPAAAGIVKSRHVVTAVSLLAVAMGTTSILGPLLGGSLLGLIQPSGCYALITVSFLLSFLALLPMKITLPATTTTHKSVWKDLVDGLSYIKNDKTLLALILIAALVNLFVFPCWFTLVPIFAHDVLQTDASGFGQLMAAIGLGRVAGALIVASLPDSTNKEKLIITTAIIWPALTMTLAATRLFPLSLVLLASGGVAQGLLITLIQAVLIQSSTEEMRGRVIGARAFAIGTLPLGNLLSGGGADLWGVPMMLLINGSASILITILIALWFPDLRKRR